MHDSRYDLTRLTLAVLFIAALIGISLWIVSPFLPAIIWAATLVIATWPIMRALQARLWNRRALAVTVMTLVLLLLFVVPFWFAIGIIVRNAGQIVGWAESIASMEFPPSPAWLAALPMVRSHRGFFVGPSARARARVLCVHMPPEAIISCRIPCRPGGSYPRRTVRVTPVSSDRRVIPSLGARYSCREGSRRAEMS